MTRTEINQKITQNYNQINTLKNEIVELQKQAILLSDEEQQFTEEVEYHPKTKFQRKPNYLDGKLVGRIHWVENYKDESDGTLIPIKRTRVVRINGEWI